MHYLSDPAYNFRRALVHSFFRRESSVTDQRPGRKKHIRSNLKRDRFLELEISNVPAKGEQASVYRGYIIRQTDLQTIRGRTRTKTVITRNQPMRIAFENYASVSPIRDSLFPAERSFPSFCAPLPPSSLRRTRYYPHNERMRAYVSACSAREGQAST